MAQVTIKQRSGGDAGTVELAEAIFGIEPNTAVMHQVVTAQLAARRSGTQSTKTRAEVRGGGAKPWKQKGTGRARQGSIRSPQWVGGGVALGPKPRSYAQRTPKKMVRLALRSALSDRASEGKVIVVDDWGFDTPRTKDAKAALAAIGATGKVLLVLDGADVTAWKSFRNLTDVHLLEAGQLNAYDVLVSDVVVFTRSTLPSAEGEAPARPKAARERPAPAPAASAPTEPTTDATEDDDMASDLPNRPPADPAKKSAPVDATERVKPVTEKTDPRFEAARQKAAKEDALRAKAGAAKAGEDAPVADDAEADDDKPKGGFSFSNTVEDDS
jgi:large subunit ribosomal protein L4